MRVRRLLTVAATVVGLAAGGLAAGLAIPVAMAGSSAATPAYSANDVGFAEGAGTDDADLDTRLSGIVAAVPGKTPFIRVDLDWAYVQSCATCALAWDHLDPVVDGAAAHGIRVLLILGYAPSWANGGHTDKWFPTTDSDWTSIVSATVNRYAGNIAAYEVWNEPNNENFGDYATDRETRYWQLVELAYNQVHSVCTACTVLSGADGGGTPSTPAQNVNDSATWLDWAYTNGYGAYFDAVAHHPYPAWNSGKRASDPECTVPWWDMYGPASQPSCGELGKVRAVMVAHGDSAKQIWATEFGYPTSGATGLSVDVVQDRLTEGIDMWRRLSYAGPLFLYSYRDACVDATDPECDFGMVDRNFNAKGNLTASVSHALTGAWPASLAAGQTLRRWTSLLSPDGAYQLWMQGDDNLVIYHGGAGPIWATNTYIDPTTRTGDQASLTNQNDGNLVLRRDDGTIVWTSATYGNGPSTLWMQGDGNLVLYRDSDGKSIWASNTSR